MSVGGSGPIQRLQQAWTTAKANLPSMPKMTMPTKAEVGQKLNDLKGKFTKDNLQSAAKSAGKGLKKGGGYILMGGGILVGSKYGGDKAISKGSDMIGEDKTIKKGEATHKREQTGLKIKKGWGSVVKGFGEGIEAIGKKIRTSEHVGYDSKLFDLGLKLESKGGSIAFEGQWQADVAQNKMDHNEQKRES